MSVKRKFARNVKRAEIKVRQHEVRKATNNPDRYLLEKKKINIRKLRTE